MFSAEAVRGAVSGMRQIGKLIPGAPGHPRHDPKGMFVVAGLDPAMARNTAAVVLAVERDTGKRWVLDVFNGTTTPT